MRETTRRLCEAVRAAAPSCHIDPAQLAIMLDRELGFLMVPCGDDVAGALFVELAETSENDQAITLETVTRVIRRVVKRVYRDFKRRAAVPLVTDPPTSDSGIDIDRVIAAFRKHLESKAAVSDLKVFDYAFVEHREISEICKFVGLKKTAVYERMKLIEHEFRNFLADWAFLDAS